MVILGGGYTGLWTAYRLMEITPGARIVLLESDICGGGPSGRIAIGGGGGRAGFGGRIGPAFTDNAQSTARAAAGLRRLFPLLRDVRIEDAWGGPIDITADHLPAFASIPGRPIHFGHGYSGNGVAPSVVGGRILAALAVEQADDPALALPLAGALPRAFPPEPFRYAGARVVREAIVRREQAEEREEPVGRVLREVTRLPKRLGYHLGMDQAVESRRTLGGAVARCSRQVFGRQAFSPNTNWVRVRRRSGALRLSRGTDRDAIERG